MSRAAAQQLSLCWDPCTLPLVLVLGSVSPWTFVPEEVPSTLTVSTCPLGDGEVETIPIWVLQLDFYSFLVELSHE